MVPEGALLSAACVAIASEWITIGSPQFASSRFVLWVAYFGSVFFPACILVALWLSFASKAAVLTVTSKGFSYPAVSPRPIEWTSVSTIRNWGTSKASGLVFAIEPAAAETLDLTPWGKREWKVNCHLGADGIFVRTSDLDIDPEALFNLCQERWSLARASAPEKEA